MQRCNMHNGGHVRITDVRAHERAPGHSVTAIHGKHGHTRAYRDMIDSATIVVTVSMCCYMTQWISVR